MNINELVDKLKHIDTNKYTLAEITYTKNKLKLNELAFLDGWGGYEHILLKIEGDILHLGPGEYIDDSYDFKLVKHWKENYIEITMTYKQTIDELLDQGYSLRQIQQIMKGEN